MAATVTHFGAGANEKKPYEELHKQHDLEVVRLAIFSRFTAKWSSDGPYRRWLL
jgi:hypothetical protein